MKVEYRSGIHNGVQFIINNKLAFIKRVENNQIYILRNSKEISELEKYSHVIKWNRFDFLLLLNLIICLGLFTFQLKPIFLANIGAPNNKVLVLLFVIFNVMIHELCHAILIKMYFEFFPKIKVKWIWILPYFSVDSTVTYLLPPWRQIFVYSAGIEINIIVNQFTYFLLGTPDALSFTLPVTYLILMNLLPIGGVKTDGFNILFISILNRVDILKPTHPYNKICKIIITVAIAIYTFKLLFK